MVHGGGVAGSSGMSDDEFEGAYFLMCSSIRSSLDRGLEALPVFPVQLASRLSTSSRGGLWSAVSVSEYVPACTPRRRWSLAPLSNSTAPVASHRPALPCLPSYLGTQVGARSTFNGGAARTIPQLVSGDVPPRQGRPGVKVPVYLGG